MTQNSLTHPRRPVTIALVGPDGAGKSTVARRVARRLPMPSRYLYMGVNLESSPEMLPTTRFVLALKRRRGGRPDLTARIPRGVAGRRAGILRTARSLARMSGWIAEEWYRLLLARRAQRRGALVVFDRHFFCDYYASDIRPGDASRPLASRIHGAMLRHWYPRPDLTIMLDAPAAVLVARKPEGTLDNVERLRSDYLALAGVLPAFAVVDADRPVDAVVDEVVGRIVEFVAANSQASPARADDRPVETEPEPAPLP
jgi:thymidylate kinase